MIRPEILKLTAMHLRQEHPEMDDIQLDYFLLVRTYGIYLPSNGSVYMVRTASRPALGPIQPVGIGREADHSSPSSADVKNGGAIPPHAIVLKHRDNFTLLTI
jgi:hypothetical protein